MTLGKHARGYLIVGLVQWFVDWAVMVLLSNGGMPIEPANVLGRVAGAMLGRDIDEQLISDHLYTAGLPDPDLLIRTAGELRVSNYLLWQISYAELFVSDTLWPDWSVET